MPETVETIPPQSNAANARGGYITFEEYLELSGDTRGCEWVDGEIINMPEASFEHQDLSGFLSTILRVFVQQKDLGVFLYSPFAMKLEAQRRGREPDILFVGKDKLDLIKKNYLDGAADLVIEIISRESIGRDRGEKFVEYEAAGIKEFWLIDPTRRQVEFYNLNERGFYQLADTTEGVFRSQVLPEFVLSVEWLWQKNLPTVGALKELNLI